MRTKKSRRPRYSRQPHDSRSRFAIFRSSPSPSQDCSPLVASVDFPEDGRKAHRAPAAGQRRGHRRPRRPMGRPRLLQRPFAHRPARPYHGCRTKPLTRRSSPAGWVAPSSCAATGSKLDAVTDAYRLVHSEGDGLSGLVVDRFGSTIVLEFFAAGMYRFREAHSERHACPLSRQPVLLVRRGACAETGIVRLPAARTAAAGVDHGTRRPFPRRAGQQAQDRLLSRSARQSQFLASFCGGKRVLDLCCNTGGFAVYAKVSGRRRRSGRHRSRRAGAGTGPAERRV